MFREGEIAVRLALAQGRIAAVGIGSTRAPLPAAMTRGRAPGELAQLVPRLYAVCGQAQGAAAAAALDAAAEVPSDAEATARRALAVTREAIVELATRQLLDWPRALGAAPQVAPLARLRQADHAGFDATAHDVAALHVFGEGAAAWLARSGLDAWTEAATTLPARLLAQLLRDDRGLGSGDITLLPDGETWLDGLPPLDDAGFAARPMWRGAPAQVGPLAWHRGHPLLAGLGRRLPAHFVAQLIDLAVRLAARPPAADTLAARRLADGTGAAVAATARGPLLHQARVENGKVTGYRVVAPTEWNFHPEGALVRGLLHRSADAEGARRDAAWLVQALDPCVACRIEVADA